MEERNGPAETAAMLLFFHHYFTKFRIPRKLFLKPFSKKNQTLIGLALGPSLQPQLRESTGRKRNRFTHAVPSTAAVCDDERAPLAEFVSDTKHDEPSHLTRNNEFWKCWIGQPTNEFSPK